MAKMTALHIRIPQEVWAFLKKMSVDQRVSLNACVVDVLTKYKEKCEKRLKKSDTIVPSRKPKKRK